MAEAEARHQHLLDAATKRAAELDSQVRVGELAVVFHSLSRYARTSHQSVVETGRKRPNRAHLGSSCSLKLKQSSLNAQSFGVLLCLPQVHSLMEQKYSLDAKLSETSTKLGSATGELTAAREELATLRTSNKSMDSVSHELEKQLTQATIEMAALKTQVRVVSSVYLEGTAVHYNYTLSPSRYRAGRVRTRLACLGKL